MSENRELAIHKLFFFVFAFYLEILTAQNKFPLFLVKEFPLPTGASKFALGDFNNDGLCDIVIASKRAITCLKNEENLNFNFYFTIPVRETPADLQICDLERNSEPEIISVYKSNSTVEIFKTDTLGFKKFRTIETGIYPEMLICADVDLNGLNDIITTGKIMLGITINYQTDSLKFSNPTNLFPKIPLKKIQIIDLNYDDVPDVVGIDWLNNLLLISYGRGDGKFGRTYTYKLPEEPTDFAISDFNGDGFFDYVIVFYYLDEVQFYYTTEAGITQGFKFKIPKPTLVCTGDVNGDGLKDVIAGNGEKFFLFINQKTNFEQYEFSSSGFNQINFFDLDGNGRDEIIVLDTLNNKLRIFYSTDQIEISDNSTIAVGSNLSDFATGDFNRDNFVDLVFVGKSSELLLIYPQNNSFTSSSIKTGKPFTDIKFLSASDFNYFLCSNYETSDISLFLSRGSKNIREIFRYKFDKPKPIFIGLSGDNSVIFFLTISDSNLIILKPNGETTFDEFTIKEIDSTKVIASLISDFNNDGYFDVAVVNSDGKNVRLNIFLRAKEGEYLKNYSVNLNSLIRNAFLFAGDFNNDGFTDILAYYDYSTSKISDGEITLLINDGSGKFRVRKRVDIHIHLGGQKLLKVADFTGDFKKDFVLFDKLRNGFYLYVNEDGEFKKLKIGTSKDKINSIGVADINRDGFPDLLFLNETNGTCNILINKDGFLK